MPLDAPHKAHLPRIAMQAEMLDAETEYRLAIAWRDHGDEAALHRLITAYMRRVQTKLEREAMAQGAELAGYRLREKIASEIGVPLRDVELMTGRLAGTDLSLNASQSSDGESREWIEALEDEAPRGDQLVERAHDLSAMHDWLMAAMAGLSTRERHIVRERQLSDAPRTLESLGCELGLSKERIRQLESAAIGKMRLHLELEGSEVHNLLV